jgi:hypothetical protein
MTDPTVDPPESKKEIRCEVCDSVLFSDGSAKKVSALFKELTSFESDGAERIEELEAEVKKLKVSLKEAEKKVAAPAETSAEEKPSTSVTSPQPKGFFVFGSR